MLDGFRGNLKWIHDREGHAGRPYWPGGESGITLDPGIDLGQQTEERIAAIYSTILTPEQVRAIQSVIGIRGTAAEDLLKTSDETLKGIRISRAQAEALFPFVADSYWARLVTKFVGLVSVAAPAAGHTAMLSIGYNRGEYNKGLNVLLQPIRDQDWREVASLIGGMQQDHKLRGIRERRRAEAQIILDEIGET